MSIAAVIALELISRDKIKKENAKSEKQEIKTEDADFEIVEQKLLPDNPDDIPFVKMGYGK